MRNLLTTGTVLGQPSTTFTPTHYSASTSKEHRSLHQRASLSTTITKNPWGPATTPPAPTPPALSPTTSTKSSQTGTTPSASATASPSTAATFTPRPTGNSSPPPSRRNLSAPRSWRAWPSGSTRRALIARLRISMRRRERAVFPARILWRGRLRGGILRF